jgi:hypothetical protein
MHTLFTHRICPWRLYRAVVLLPNSRTFGFRLYTCLVRGIAESGLCALYEEVLPAPHLILRRRLHISPLRDGGHRVDQQCNKYACVTVFPGRRPSGAGAHRAMSSELRCRAPSSVRPFGKKRRCISLGPISSLAWDLGADPRGVGADPPKRTDVGLAERVG